MESSAGGKYWSLSPQGHLVIRKGFTMTKSVGWKFFSLRDKVHSAEVEEGITDLPSGCLEYFSGMESVSLPSTLLTIGQNAFQSCSSLREISLPPSLRSIGQFAFHECYALERIHIPASVEKMDTLGVYVGEGNLREITVDPAHSLPLQ